MNFEMIDLLDKAIDKDIEYDKILLRNEGVLTGNGEIVKNKLNLMTGAYATNLLDAIEEADMSVQEIIEHVERLYQGNQLTGVFYFLLYLITALGIELPYLYMQLPSHEAALRFYIGELIADMKDCFMDKNE